jgi:hypothetical protein
MAAWFLNLGVVNNQQKKSYVHTCMHICSTYILSGKCKGSIQLKNGCDVIQEVYYIAARSSTYWCLENLHISQSSREDQESI